MKNIGFSGWIFCVILLLQISTSICSAQLNATVFEEFTSTILNPYLINPSAYDTSHSYKIQANNISQLGIIKNVNRFYLDGDIRISSARKNAFHFLGIQAINSKFGDYINRSRLHFRYSWLTQISEKASLSSGVSFGFLNYAFLTTQGGTGGSDYAPDGNLGIHYLRPGTTIGFSMQQLFPAVLIPINQSFQIKRLFNVDISQRVEVNSKIKLNAFSVIQHSMEQSIIYNLGVTGQLYNFIFLGISNFSMKKSSVNMGVQQIPLLGAKFMIIVTYSAYHNTFPLPDNTLEVYFALHK